MTKILSVSVLPVSGVWTFHEDPTGDWKTPVYGFACILVRDDDSSNHIQFIPVTAVDFNERCLPLKEDGSSVYDDLNEAKFLYDKGFDVPLTDHDLLQLVKKPNSQI